MFLSACISLVHVLSHSIERYGTTYKIASNNAVQELDRADSDQEPKEHIQQLGPLRGLVEVLVPDRADDGLDVLGAADRAGSVCVAGRLLRWCGRLGARG